MSFLLLICHLWLVACWLLHCQSCRYVPSETIVLDDVNLVAAAPDRAVAHGYETHCCFSVATPKRTFYVLTESVAERDDWMAAIELNVFLRQWKRERGLLSLDYVKQPPREGRRAAVINGTESHTVVTLFMYTSSAPLHELTTLHCRLQ